MKIICPQILHELRPVTLFRLFLDERRSKRDASTSAGTTILRTDTFLTRAGRTCDLAACCRAFSCGIPAVHAFNRVLYAICRDGEFPCVDSEDMLIIAHATFIFELAYMT